MGQLQVRFILDQLRSHRKLERESAVQRGRNPSLNLISIQVTVQKAQSISLKFSLNLN